MNRDPLLALTPFKDIDLASEFFDSLRGDYQGFDDWFRRKAEERAYVLTTASGALCAFLYLKIEEGPVEDVTPNLPAGRHLKVGTLKIEAHGTRLGERMLKKVFDNAIAWDVDDIYVTVFEKHQGLVALLQRYGFVKIANKGGESVYGRPLWQHCGDVLKDYPQITVRKQKQYLLAIWPEFHTRLFPDSILDTEPLDIVEDVSHSNSIRKIYISFSRDAANLKAGDGIVIYRTSDGKGPAYHRAVATSLCVVEEAREWSSFNTEQEYLTYCSGYSVFTDEELVEFYRTKRSLVVLKFTYNAALKRRLTRKVLLEVVGVRDDRWVVMPLPVEQFQQIASLGGVNERLVVY